MTRQGWISRASRRSATALLACALALTSTLASAQTVILDRVIAIVDDDVILASEFQGRMAAVQKSMTARGGEAPPEDVIAQEVLERMILERIQLQMGERAGVRFSDAEVNEAMSSIAAQAGMSLEQFRQQLEADGRSYAGVREQVVQEMTLNSVQQGNLRSKVHVTEQDVDNFLRSEAGQQRTAAAYHLAHLLLPLSSEADEADEKAASDYLTTLRAAAQVPGAFESLVSNPPQEAFALSGGDLGWRSAANLPDIFAGVAPELGNGEVSEPIRSASGYHLIKLIGKRGGSGQTISQTKVRHILIKPSEIRSEVQSRELAESLRQRIVDGEDFADLAREFSEDYGSALEGGDLGWASPGQMVPEFEAMMNATLSGSVSEVFPTPYGFHFLEVLDRRVKDVSQEMKRNQARNILYQERFEEELQLWLRQIRDEAFVEIKL